MFRLNLPLILKMKLPSKQKNIQLQHDEVAKNDKNEIPNEVSQQHDSSNNSELKLGRNDKVELISPSGERDKVKFKKTQSAKQKENKIVTRFWIVGILLALLSLATFKIR